MVIVYGRVSSQTIGSHDVFLDTAHDLLDSIVESSGQYNREPNGSHTKKSMGLM